MAALRLTILTALTGLSLALPAPTTAPEIRWIDCASNVPEPLQGVKLPSSLPSTLRCGRLDVPMDYSKPISAENNITIGFSLYHPQNPKGLITFTPGDANGEVSSFAWQVALNLSDAAWFEGLGNFDFLAMDIRGSFSSNALNCSVGNVTLPSSFPTNETAFGAYQAIASNYAQSCIENGTPSGILAHLSTNEIIQDWDAVRQALHYDIMHTFTWSYGTYIAAAYANAYPDHVGRFVLDAILPHGISDVDLVTFEIAAENRLLLRADAFCINDTTCPFHSQGKGSVLQAFSKVLELASGNVTADDVRAVVSLNYLSGNPDFPGLNEALYGALNGNWSALSYSEFGPSYTQAVALALTTLCLDQREPLSQFRFTYNFGISSQSQRDADSNFLDIDNNTFAGFESLRQSIALNDSAQIMYSQQLSVIALCGGWPYHGNSDKPLPITSPLLLVTSDFDGGTPTEAASFTWEQAPNSTLVVRHGDDRGTLFVPGPAHSFEIDFLATGNIPGPINETFVSVYPPGSVRGAVLDPYVVPVGAEAGDISSD